MKHLSTAEAGTPARSAVVADSLLMASSAIVLAVAGFGFWAVAGRRMDPEELAHASALISAGVFIGGVAQLNFVGSLPAILPTRGRGGAGLLLRCYAVAGTIAVVMAGGLEVVGHVGVDVPHAGGWMSFVFVGGVGLWTIFSIQDAALVAVGSARLVPIENAVFSLGRVAFVIALAGLAPTHAALTAWFVPAALCLLPVNLHLRGRFRRGTPTPAPPPARHLLVADAAASVFTQAQTRLVPFVAVLLLDGLAAAQVAVVWLFWTTADVLLGNTGVAATVAITRAEGADERRHQARRVVLLDVALMSATAIGGAVLAVPLLRIVLPEADADGAFLLRLALLSLVPRSLYHVGLVVARGTGRHGPVLALPVIATVALYTPVVAAMAGDDLHALGWAILLSQVLLGAGVALWTRRALAGEPRGYRHRRAAAADPPTPLIAGSPT